MAWSYDAVVNFVARVRQDVEALPSANQRALAKAVHDNGYWKGQELRVRDRSDPFICAKFKASDEALQAVLTPKGFEAYRGRYGQGAGGYRLALDAVADRAALYRLEGKNIPRASELPGNTSIVNANAQSWDDLVADAQRYPNPGERLAVIMRNQLNGIASALSLLRASRTARTARWTTPRRSSGVTPGTTADATDGSANHLCAFPTRNSEAEKAKDRDVWRAVRDALAAR
jgi:hypothetical protein